MYRSHARTRFRAWPNALHALSINCCLVHRTRSYTSTAILQQMLRTIPYTCRSVCVLAIWIRFPQIIGRIVLLHWRAFLFANAIVVEIPTGQAIFLRGSRTAAGAKQMTTIARFRSKTTALRALRRTVCLAEFLAIVRTFAPAASLAAGMTERTIALRRCKVVRILETVLGSCFLMKNIVFDWMFKRAKIFNLTCYDLVPIDCTHVTQIVIVKQSNRAVQNVPQCWQLQRVHL